MRILTQSDVQQAMDMDACIRANHDAYIAIATGRARVPVRHQIGMENEADAVALFMPGYLPDLGALGMKIVSVFPSNRTRGLMGTIGTILLVSAHTGEALALLAGTWLTGLRTGAGTGVATQHMARPDSKVLTLVGAGGMGFHQIEAVLAVRPVEIVWIWNRTPERAEALADEVRTYYGRQGRHVVVETVRDVAAAVSRSDVVIASTAASTPVVLGEWVKPGTHVNLIGAHGADMREGDDALLLQSRVRAVDSFDSAARSGELAIPLAAGIVHREDFVDVGAIAAGLSPGRHSPEDITWFKSVGHAAQDMASCAAILKRAQELSLGTEIAIEK